MSHLDSLFDSLAGVLRGGSGTVVHIGAGAGVVLERYKALAPARVVLIEGDAGAAAELSRLARGMPWADVRATAVSPLGGNLPWHRYSLPALNGPLDAMALAAYYPRLRLLASDTCETLSLVSLLDSLDLAPQGGGNVLVLDVPGQEGALLASLPNGTLGRFDAILMRGCSQSLPGSGLTAEQVVESLQARCWQAEPAAAQLEPLWPVRLMRFDRVRHEQNFWRERVARLEAVASQRELDSRRVAADLEQLRTDLAAQTQLAGQRHAELEQMRRHCGEQAQRLVAGAEREQALQAQLAGEVQSATAEAQRLRSELAEQADLAAVRLQDLQASRVQNDQCLQRIAQLEVVAGQQELAARESESEREQLRSELAAQTLLVNQRQGELEAVTQQCGEQAQGLAAAAEREQALRAQLASEVQSAMAAASQHEVDIRQLEAEREQLRSELAAQSLLEMQRQGELEVVTQQCSEQAQSLAAGAEREEALRAQLASEVQSATAAASQHEVDIRQLEAEREQLRLELAAQSLLVIQRQSELEAMAKQCGEQAQSLVAGAEREEALRAQLASEVQSATAAASQHEVNIRQLEAEREQLRSELAAQCLLATQRQSELEQVTQQCSEQSQRLATDAEREQALRAQLDAELQSAAAQAEQLRGRIEEQAGLAAARLQELQAAQAQLQSLQGQVEAHATVVAQCESAVRAAQAGLAGAQGELEAARQAAAAQAQAQEQHVQALQADCDLARNEAGRLQADLAASRQQGAEWQQQVQALTHSAEQARVQVEQAQRAHAEAETRHQKTLEELWRQLADARNIAGMAVKLQMLRESDLQDLQQRHTAAQSQLEKQQDLLSRLAQRLGAANQYFQQLALPVAAAEAVGKAPRQPKPTQAIGGRPARAGSGQPQPSASKPAAQRRRTAGPEVEPGIPSAGAKTALAKPPAQQGAGAKARAARPGEKQDGDSATPQPARRPRSSAANRDAADVKAQAPAATDAGTGKPTAGKP